MGSDASAGAAEKVAPDVAAAADDAADQAVSKTDGSVAADSPATTAACAESQAGEGGDAAAASVEQLRAALEQAQAEAEAQKDRALRAAAEAENVRKRADRRVENAHKYALEKFVGDLLPAVDSFERAVEAAQKTNAGADAAPADAAPADAAPADAAVAEGVQLSLKLLEDALRKQGIEVVDPLGAPFDPNLHEAMTMLESATAEPGSVMDVFQKGYTVNGRLVRAARVVVAKAPQADDAASEASEASGEDV